MSYHIPPILAVAATANATVAQMSGIPDASTLEGWLALASRVGATAVLGLACWILWKQLRREQEDNTNIRNRYMSDLAGVIDRNTKVIERVEQTIGRCNGRNA